MIDQSVVLHISRVHPHATDEELAVIMSALPSLWPAPRPQSRNTDDRAWRFSGRRHIR
jgi:hypothetical protein